MRLIVSRYSFLFVLVSFFFLIFIGTVLLMIPGVLQQGQLSFINALFLSVSSVAGTGIGSIYISSFSTCGKFIIIMLMYVGSIGILTLLLGVIFYFSLYSVEWYGLATEVLDIINIQTIYSFFKTMFLVTIFMQLFGSISLIILFSCLNFTFSFIDVFFISMNCFCNVGFNISDLVPASIMIHSAWYIITAILIIVGSSGFLLLFEVKEYLKQKYNNKIYAFSVTSKLMMQMYFISICFFWVFYFYFCEPHLSFNSLMRSFFAAVSFRSCGISPYSNLPASIIFISALYGIMGTGPLGTGGGVKSSIVGIVVYTFLFFFNKKDTVIIFFKKISWQLIAFAHIFLFYIIVLATIITIAIDLYYIHKIDFILLFADIIGLITGSGALWSKFISTMNTIEKLLCILLMCLGKIASISLSLYISKLKKSDLQYPDAKLIII